LNHFLEYSSKPLSKIDLRTLTLTILIFLLAGCMVNPVTGKQQFSLVSAQQEAAMGAQQYKPGQQSQGGRYYIDPEVQVYIREIGYKLAKVSDRPELPYDFVVLNNSVPNAWALPGGKIAINRGLLVHLQDESQLAAVLAHEIVHAAARHGASQMTRGMLTGIGLQALGAVTNNNPLGGLAAQLGSSAWMASYGRSAELESDAYGMEYMVRAGYDPYGAVALQEKFVELSKNRQTDFINGLFASHPPSQARVTANLAKAGTFPPGGVKNRGVFVKKMARIKKDLSAYQAQDKSMKALSNKAPREAMAQLDKAVKLQPREGSFWELRGHAWAMLGKRNKAMQAFTTAIGKNPDYFSHHLARGLHHYELGKMIEAQRDLQTSYSLLPVPQAALYLGDIAATNNDKKAALAYYQQAASTSGEIGQQAKARLAALEISEAPNKYIATSISRKSDGYLQLLVQNRSPIDVTNVVVQINEVISPFGSGPSTYTEFPGVLKASQQAVINTGLGPISADDPRSFRSIVIKARPTK
jgi:predicted Zn-dependent protease